MTRADDERAAHEAIRRADNADIALADALTALRNAGQVYVDDPRVMRVAGLAQSASAAWLAAARALDRVGAKRESGFAAERSAQRTSIAADHGVRVSRSGRAAPSRLRETRETQTPRHRRRRR